MASGLQIFSALGRWTHLFPAHMVARKVVQTIGCEVLWAAMRLRGCPGTTNTFAKPCESRVVVFIVHSSGNLNTFRLCWALECSLKACTIRLKVCFLQWLEFHILHASLRHNLSSRQRGGTRKAGTRWGGCVKPRVKHVSLCHKLTQPPQHDNIICYLII